MTISFRSLIIADEVSRGPLLF